MSFRESLPPLFAHLEGEQIPSPALLFAWEEDFREALGALRFSRDDGVPKDGGEWTLILRKISPNGEVSEKRAVLGFVVEQSSGPRSILCGIHNPDSLLFMTFPFIRNEMLILPQVLAQRVADHFGSL